MSVSMVAVACLAFAHAARWKGHAPHTTTGVASWSASHCQLSNWSAGIIDSASTGMVSAAEIASRRRRGAVSSAWAAGASG
jgi:hypothetical protein